MLDAQSLERKTIAYEDTLKMDLFLPRKAEGKKPVLIYVHGGGFSGGTRDAAVHMAFCERYARKGWVTATVSYHLTMKGQSFGCDQPVQNKISTFFEGGKNVNQSVAYLLEHQEELGIDPQTIVLAGSSAGAEAVMQAVYWKATQKEVLPGDFRYAAVISMAGAVLDANWISEDTAIPTALYHGTCDNLVPYGTAAHHYCDPDQAGFMMLAGAHTIMQKLKALNRPYFMVTDCGGGHEWASKPIQEPYIHFMDDFLANQVLGKQFRQTHVVLKEGSGDCPTGWGFCQ